MRGSSGGWRRTSGERWRKYVPSTIDEAVWLAYRKLRTPEAVTVVREGGFDLSRSGPKVPHGRQGRPHVRTAPPMVARDHTAMRPARACALRRFERKGLRPRQPDAGNERAADMQRRRPRKEELT
jgi:hypothetical protein